MHGSFNNNNIEAIIIFIAIEVGQAIIYKTNKWIWSIYIHVFQIH